MSIIMNWNNFSVDEQKMASVIIGNYAYRILANMKLTTQLTGYKFGVNSEKDISNVNKRLTSLIVSMGTQSIMDNITGYIPVQAKTIWEDISANKQAYCFEEIFACHNVIKYEYMVRSASQNSILDIAMQLGYSVKYTINPDTGLYVFNI